MAAGGHAVQRPHARWSALAVTLFRSDCLGSAGRAQADAEAAMAEATAGSHAAQGALDAFATRARPFSPPPGSLRAAGRFVPARPRPDPAPP